MSITTYTTKAGKTRYRVRVNMGARLDGALDVRSKTCDTSREAKRLEATWMGLAQQNGGRSDRITLCEFVETYYLPMKRKTLRKSTMRVYENIIANHIMPAFGHVPLCEIRRYQIQQILSDKNSYKIAKDTRDMLRQILGEAMQMEIIKANPASGRYKLPEKRDTDRKVAGEWVTSTAEQQRIINLAEGVIRSVLVLGFCFGLRTGEILGLDWQDVDLKRRTITIRQAYTYTKGAPDMDVPKTEGSRRTIPMSAYAFSQLKAIKGAVARVGAVCVDGDARLTPTQAQRLMKDFVLAHDVPKVTCHSLRHSFATTAIRAGVSVDLVSKALGHTNITTTYNRYVKPLQSDLLDMVEVLDRAYSASQL